MASKAADERIIEESVAALWQRGFDACYDRGDESSLESAPGTPLSEEAVKSMQEAQLKFRMGCMYVANAH